MARRYSIELRRAGVRGPLALGGWSMGGLIAMDMIEPMGLEGIDVEQLVLLDTVFPDAFAGTRLLDDENELKKILLNDFEQSDQAGQGAGWETLFGLYKTHFAAMQNFRPRKITVPVTLAMSQKTFENSENFSLKNWQGIAGAGFSMKVIQGDHYSLMKGQAAEEAADFINWNISRIRAGITPPKLQGVK